jgi:hypothetical protein
MPKWSLDRATACHRRAYSYRVKIARVGTPSRLSRILLCRTGRPIRSARRGCTLSPVFGRALVSRRISNGMLASRFDIGLMYGIRVAVGVAFEPGASGIRCNGAPASLHMIRIVRPLWRALGPCWAGFKSICHRRRSGEQNHESRDSDLGMNEHSLSPIRLLRGFAPPHRRPASAEFNSTLRSSEAVNSKRSVLQKYVKRSRE